MTSTAFLVTLFFIILFFFLLFRSLDINLYACDNTLDKAKTFYHIYDKYWELFLHHNVCKYYHYNLS